MKSVYKKAKNLQEGDVAAIQRYLSCSQDTVISITPPYINPTTDQEEVGIVYSDEVGNIKAKRVPSDMYTKVLDSDGLERIILKQNLKRCDRAGFVYKLYCGKGELLYVGKTWDIGNRFYTGRSSHSKTKLWWDEVSIAEVEKYSNELEALHIESHYINSLKPKYNKVKPRYKFFTEHNPIDKFTLTIN